MDYVVTLKFADPTATATGQRVFNVVINGQTVLPNLDVFAKATGQYPRWDATIPVTVTNGNLDIAFNSVAGAPIVNAIEIAPANSVEVIPHAPALGERQNVQFSAIVQGAPTASVLWSINPPTLGNITSTGVYTAPTSIPADTSVTVIATNAANPNQVGSTIVSLTHFDATSFTPLRVNAGGPAYTDPEGRTWVADQAFTGNWSCGSPSSAFSITPPAGSTLPVIYQTGHICDPYWGGTFTFHAAVLNQAALPNMEYFVTLKFADPTATAAGQRVFNVVINGQMVLPNLDVFAKATGQYPRWDVTIPVTVTNGNLDIAFNSVVGAPIVNAIEIVSAGQMYLFPPTAAPWPGHTVQFSALSADFANPSVAWSMIPTGIGTLTQSGLYTAPATVGAFQTVTVTATSAPNPAVSASATVYLWPPAGVTVSPQTVSLSGGQTRQFTGVPNNGSTLGVTWSSSPEGFGAISSTGTYTAPATVDSPKQITIIATSIADGSTGTATINLVPAVTVSVSPTAVTLGPSGKEQFTASVIGAWNTTVNWSVNPPGTGSITSDGVYTAPATIAANSNVTITAASVANPSAAAGVTLTLSPAAPSVTVSVTPPTVSLTPGQTQQFASTVTGTANTAVTWSIAPNAGVISASGLYTAPAAIAASQTVTVQAVSAAYPANFAAATITLPPPTTNTYGYRRAIVVDHTKVPNTDQANFPVLLSGTYSYLATPANGGKVQNPNGYDIIFTSDCAGLQKLDHEIASYNPITGTVAMWVLVPVVSHTVDTVFYLSYGDSSVTTSQENRPSLDAARNPNLTHSPDWIATAANNQNSPSTFYAIYPENANSVAPLSTTVGSSQTQQFSALFTVGALAASPNPLVLLGTSPTPSPAQSVAVNGNLAYICDNNEVSVIDVTNPANPLFLGAAIAGDIKNSGLAYCAVQNRATGPVLIAFVGAVGSWVGTNPAFVAFGLQNPSGPQLIAETSIQKSYFMQPVYSGDGNTAFVPTFAVGTSLDSWSSQNGDVVAVDISNLANPSPVGTMEPTVNSTVGGVNAMFGAALANPTTLLVGGSTSTGASNNGVGELVVTDVTNPKAMSIVTALPVPNAKQLFRPVVQGNLAVALGDTAGYNVNGGMFGPIVITWPGNLVVTTFDITNPRNPSILASIVLPYKPASPSPVPGSAIQIGPNLFLFGGAQDSSGNNLLLLVDTTNKFNPVVTPYPVPAAVTNLAIAGNLLHVTAGAAGYAVYQIPGVTPTQYGLTGSCNGPVNWTLNPTTAGSVTATGLYTAPPSITANQAVTVTATSQGDSSQTASATVNLTQVLTLSLIASAPSPYVVGNTANFVATVTAGATPVSGIPVSFTVTGVNPRTATAVTDANGHATLPYPGAARGVDSIQATASTFTSNALSALWVNPANPITTTPVTASFFTATSCPSGCEAFSTPATQVPVFLQNFPNLMFNPPAGMLGITNSTRPFTDIVLDASGAPTGAIIAQGNSVQAGMGTLAGFSAVFRGSFVVVQPGSYTINVASQDGFIFGVGNGAVRVSGVTINAPATTVFSQYPVMGANNGPSTGATAPIVVTFPVPGSYPYEFDYKSGTGGALSLAVTVTQGSTTLGLRPLESLVLTSNGTGSPRTGQSASFTVKATDESGSPIANLSVSVSVSGVTPQTLPATTDSSGQATVSYTETTPGADILQASTTVNGLQLVSSQATVTWISSQAPGITVNGTRQLQLPNSGSYTATVVDPVAPAGGPITDSGRNSAAPAR